MPKSVEGVFRSGRVELPGLPPNLPDARVIVTFLDETGDVLLSNKGINPAQAANLRARLKAFDEDWSRPEMSAYDAL